MFCLTVEELGALGVAFLHLLTFVSSCLHVAVRGGEHRRARLHQEFTDLHIVTGGSAVEGSPGDEDRGREKGLRDLFTSHLSALFSDWNGSGVVLLTNGPTCSGSNSPAVAVGSVGVDTELNQKLDDLGVAGADGIVQRRDALVVRHAGVVHLQDGHVITYLSYNLESSWLFRAF